MMWTHFKFTGLYLAVAFSFASSAAAEKTYIVGKGEDENLLMMSIVFLVVCGLFFVISVVMSLMLIRRSRLTYGSGRGYDLEITEEKFQSMYRSSEHAEEKSPAKFEQLKLNDVNNGVHDSIDDIKSSERQNNNMGKKSAPPGTEKEQKGTKESEKDTKTLSSFHNKAYQSTSMQSGMDLVESDVKR